MESISGDAGSCAGVVEMYMLGRGGHLTGRQEASDCPEGPTGGRAKIYPLACLPGTLCVQCPFLWGLVRRRLVPPHSTPWKGHRQDVASRLLWKDLSCKRAGVGSCEVSCSSTGLCLIWCSAFSLSSQLPPFRSSDS